MRGVIYRNFSDVCRRTLPGLLLSGLFLSISTSTLRADSTWVYAVRLSVTLQPSPPAITLHWQPDDYGSAGYTVYRKGKEDTSWGVPIATLNSNALSYTDTAVAV